MIEFLAIAPFVLIVITYVLYFIFRSKIKIKERILKTVLRIHFSVAITIITLLVLSAFDILLNSIWLIKVISWLFFLTGLLIVLFKKRLKGSFESSYSDILLFSPLALIATWLVPMLGAWI